MAVPAHATSRQLKSLNTYLDFKIHVLQKFLVHCVCKLVDGSQEHPTKEKQRHRLNECISGNLFQPCVTLMEEHFNTEHAGRSRSHTREHSR